MRSRLLAGGWMGKLVLGVAMPAGCDKSLCQIGSPVLRRITDRSLARVCAEMPVLRTLSVSSHTIAVERF